MPSSRFLIASNTLGSAAATVTFSNIPGTYTDLILRITARDTDSGQYAFLKMNVNGTTANYSNTNLYSEGGTTTASSRVSNYAFWEAGQYPKASQTSNTFGSTEIYIPSYTISQNKPASTYGIAEGNFSSAYNTALSVSANLWRNTAAITEVSFTAANQFVAGSSFFLYGLKNT